MNKNELRAAMALVKNFRTQLAICAKNPTPINFTIVRGAAAGIVGFSNK